MAETLNYDFIIAGMGCAGLSMAMQLKQSSVKFNKVLIVDKEFKNKNDRTWCFWTKEKANWYDTLVFKRWGKISFKSNSFEKTFLLDPYQYFMIRGVDFYNYCLMELKNDTRFEILTDTITQIKTEGDFAILKTKTANFSATYLFNSAFRNLNKKENHINYVQHFKGWLVKTETDVFDVECPLFMDFSVAQHNDCRFVYIIPFSKNTALIEYTGFSVSKLDDAFYDLELNNYLQNHLGIESYTILEIEKGEIPMMESEFINPYGSRVINIGTAGGSSKPSTGYTFYFIQKNCKKIIQQLEHTKEIIIPPKRNKRFLLYDKILLTVLNKKEPAAATIFTDLFQKNKIKNLLAFLNEESSLTQDIIVMNSVSKKHFGLAALKRMIGPH